MVKEDSVFSLEEGFRATMLKEAGAWGQVVKLCICGHVSFTVIFRLCVCVAQ